MANCKSQRSPQRRGHIHGKGSIRTMTAIVEESMEAEDPTTAKRNNSTTRKKTELFKEPNRGGATGITDDTAASSSTSSPNSSSSSGHSNIPALLRHFEGKFQNRRGQSLFYFSLFPPEKMPLRGVILCLHGIGDHCRRYISLYERLCDEGFGVISYDLVNHGASDYDSHNTRAHINNFRFLVDDTNAFIAFAKRSIYSDALQYWREHHHPHHPHGRDTQYVAPPELPLIIAGTSFGSLIGLHTVLSGRHKFHAAVWASPTIGVAWTPVLFAESLLSRPLATLFPTAHVVPAVQHELLCRNPFFVGEFAEDPLTCMDKMTTRSADESLHAMLRLQQDERVAQPESAFCAVPTLFLAGSADKIADQQAAIRFFARMGNFDKEFKLFDGFFHLVYEDPEKEAVIQHLAHWLRRRFPIETRHSY